MNILINNRSGVPIYEQIYTQIKNHIISGAVSADEMLPSILNPIPGEVTAKTRKPGIRQ